MNEEFRVNYVYEEKQGKKYVETFRCDDAQQVYEDLARELVSKKINECGWIRSIKREQRYDHVKIIVTYDHGGRRVYTVSSKW